MEPTWLATLKAAVVKIKGIARYWRIAVNFVKRVSTVDELREAKQIENMTKYLEAVAKSLAVMKKAGVPDEEIRRLALDLNVPLIQANLEAMIIARGRPSTEARREASERAGTTIEAPTSSSAGAPTGSNSKNGAPPPAAQETAPSGSNSQRDGTDQSTEGASVPGP